MDSDYRIDERTRQLIKQFCDSTNFLESFVESTYVTLVKRRYKKSKLGMIEPSLDYTLYLCTHFQKEIGQSDCLKEKFSKHFKTYFPKWLGGRCPIAENETSVSTKDMIDYWRKIFSHTSEVNKWLSQQ